MKTMQKVWHDSYWKEVNKMQDWFQEQIDKLAKKELLKAKKKKIKSFKKNAQYLGGSFINKLDK